MNDEVIEVTKVALSNQSHVQQSKYGPEVRPHAKRDNTAWLAMEMAGILNCSNSILASFSLDSAFSIGIQVASTYGQTFCRRQFRGNGWKLETYNSFG